MTGAFALRRDRHLSIPGRTLRYFVSSGPTGIPNQFPSANRDDDASPLLDDFDTSRGNEQITRVQSKKTQRENDIRQLTVYDIRLS